VPDPVFAAPRLAEIYDVVAGERKDLDHYLAIAADEERGPGRDLVGPDRGQRRIRELPQDLRIRRRRDDADLGLNQALPVADHARGLAAVGRIYADRGPWRPDRPGRELVFVAGKPLPTRPGQQSRAGPAGSRS
jgi:hypothetical protein